MLFLCCWLTSVTVVFSQKTGQDRNGNAISAEDQLIENYLSADGDINQKIQELLDLAVEDGKNGRSLDQIKKFQMGLLLEEQLPAPSRISFELNCAMAVLLYTMDPHQAAKYYDRAIQIAQRVAIAPEVMERLHGAYGSMQLGQQKYSAAYENYLKALEFARSVNNSILIAAALNNIGIYHSRLNHADSSMYYYNQAIIALKSGRIDSLLQCSIRDNIAEEYMKNGQYQEAVSVYRSNDSITFQLSESDKYKNDEYRKYHRYITNKIKLADALEKRGAGGAEKQLNELHHFIKGHYSYENRQEMLDFYKFATGYFLRHANVEKARSYRQLYLNLNDSLRKERNLKQQSITETLLHLQSKAFENEIAARNEMLKATKKLIFYHRFSIGITICLSVIIISLLCLLIISRRRKHKAEQLAAKTELDKKNMEAEIARHDVQMKQKDITNLALQTSRIYETNQELINELQEIANSKEDAIVSLRSLLKGVQLKDQKNEEFINIQKNIEVINADFYSKLKKTFPSLTASDLELCGYLRLQLSNKEIASLRNIAPESVKRNKNRLRKKLELFSGTDLHDFLLNM